MVQMNTAMKPPMIFLRMVTFASTIVSGATNRDRIARNS